MIKSKEEIKKSFLLICITSNLQKDEGNHPTIKCSYIYYTISKLLKTIEQVKIFNKIKYGCIYIVIQDKWLYVKDISNYLLFLAIYTYL